MILNGMSRRIATVRWFPCDCTFCRFGWFSSSVMLQQILVETHFPDHQNKRTFDQKAGRFFKELMHEGYVIFHKEPNIIGCGGACVEYGFLKMSDSFFNVGGAVRRSVL
jgi:hypothetical protein